MVRHHFHIREGVKVDDWIPVSAMVLGCSRPSSPAPRPSSSPSPWLKRPVDCVVPVSSSTSLRAMAKAMKKAAAEPAPAMKKAMRRAMKAMKTVGAEAKGAVFAKKAMKAAAMKAMKTVGAEAKSAVFAKKAMKAAMKAMK